MLNILLEKDYIYQVILPLQFNLSFENNIAHDDILSTVLEITGGINLIKYFDFTNRNTHGYNGINMFCDVEKYHQVKRVFANLKQDFEYTRLCR